MDKTTIIVVEDNIVYCEFVCNMLAREGYRTVKAYNLSTAKKHGPLEKVCGYRSTIKILFCPFIKLNNG